MDNRDKDDYRGKALKLTDLVEYSAGSVVSKTLIKKDKGTLTLFAFDKGEELSEHTAPFDAFLQLLDGEAEVKIGGESIGLSAGQTVIMPADVPHSVKAISKFKMLLVMIRG